MLVHQAQEAQNSTKSRSSQLSAIPYPPHFSGRSLSCIYNYNMLFIQPMGLLLWLYEVINHGEASKMFHNLLLVYFQ